MQQNHLICNRIEACAVDTVLLHGSVLAAGKEQIDGEKRLTVHKIRSALDARV